MRQDRVHSNSDRVAGSDFTGGSLPLQDTGFLSHTPDFRAREGRFRVPLHIKEFLPPQMLLPFRVIGVDAVQIDLQVHRASSRTVFVTGQAAGGQNRVLAWRWTFSGGGSASGRTVTHRFREGAELAATLTVTDGSGATASATAKR
jgi:hypothetical protein